MSTASAADDDKREGTLNKFTASEIMGDKLPQGETRKPSRRPQDKGKQFEIEKGLKCSAKSDC